VYTSAKEHVFDKRCTSCVEQSATVASNET